jgi:hypothetical protein
MAISIGLSVVCSASSPECFHPKPGSGLAFSLSGRKHEKSVWKLGKL